MLASASKLRSTLFELGFWATALYLAWVLEPQWEAARAAIGSLVLARMLFGMLHQSWMQKRISKDISTYLDDAFPR
jgi:hypothetical protein